LWVEWVGASIIYLYGCAEREAVTTQTSHAFQFSVKTKKTTPEGGLNLFAKQLVGGEVHNLTVTHNH
jgi:hypothetical protein